MILLKFEYWFGSLNQEPGAPPANAVVLAKVHPLVHVKL